MHEISICEGILRVIEEQAVAQNFKEVKSVRLEVGPMAGVELEALRFSYEVVTRGTIADNSKLEVIPVPASAWCLPCSKPVSVKQRFEACPQCGYRSARIESGDEYYLIVDSRLPNLMETFTSLQQRDSSSVIVIDRRIGQNPIAGADRRR